MIVFFLVASNDDDENYDLKRIMVAFLRKANKALSEPVRISPVASTSLYLLTFRLLSCFLIHIFLFSFLERDPYSDHCQIGVSLNMN